MFLKCMSIKILTHIIMIHVFNLLQDLTYISIKIPTHSPHQNVWFASQDSNTHAEIRRQSGSVFRSSPKFISCIRQHLCLSLLKNGVSSSPRVFNATLQVFVTLIVHFKMHLKQEISVFFNTIFLRILESPNSTYQQKMMVTQVRSVFSLYVWIYINVHILYACMLW
jgi:Sec7-like guanine-nucleotide exchange factor